MTELRRSLMLKSRPDGEPGPANFEMVERPLPQPSHGEVLTRTIWLSIDPYMRGRLYDRASYAPVQKLGEPMTGETVGQVIASAAEGFAPGDYVVGSRGWETHTLTPATSLTKIERPGAPLQAYLGILGMPGVTAYSGMTDIAQVKPGETVVVSAASGAVGAVAGQIAKRAGARVVGVAGGPDKCLWVQQSLGFDACIDHRSQDIAAGLRDACPNGIDVYWENVGGAVQAAAFAQLNFFARVVMCGMVAQYNEAKPPPGPNLGFVVGKRVRIEGLIVFDKPHRYAEWRALAAPWVADGSLRYRETVIDGLEQAPDALAEVLRGGNFGKMLVRVAAE